MIDKYLYHVTYKKNVNSILKNGLLTLYGDNSKLAFDGERSGVFLCDYKDVPYWLILLGADTILKVWVNDIEDYDSYSYGLYSEYIFHCDIGPSRIESIVNLLVTKEHMRGLCASYTKYLCSYVRRVMLSGELNLKGSEEVKEGIEFFEGFYKRLAWNEFSSYEKSTWLYDYSDEGLSPFTDFYRSSGKRIWEFLENQYDDGLNKHREILLKIVKELFSDCLYLDTGRFLD